MNKRGQRHQFRGSHDDAGGMAALANGEQLDSLEELMNYESGDMSHSEAVDRGVLDEDGSMPSNVMPTWGVHDAQSLAAELDRCEVMFYRSERQAGGRVHAWVSGGKVCYPASMTTPHLVNAIKFADRKRISGTVVDAMRIELSRRVLVRQAPAKE